MKLFGEAIGQKLKTFREKHWFFCMVSPYVLFAVVLSLIITKENLEKWWQLVPDYVGRALLCGMIIFSWGGIGLLFGRTVSGWFPFLPSAGCYLRIRSKFLQKLLIGRDNLYWGRTGPKGLPEQYYRVSPQNRDKMCVWGVLFYTGWLVLTALVCQSSRLPERLAALLYPMLLAWPLIMIGLGNWDYSRGFHRLAEDKKEQNKKE